MKFENVIPGKWIQPIERGYLMACCDCSLVHRMDFRVKNGRAQLRAWRNEKYTKMVRKKNGIIMHVGKREEPRP